VKLIFSLIIIKLLFWCTRILSRWRYPQRQPTNSNPRGILPSWETNTSRMATISS